MEGLSVAGALVKVGAILVVLAVTLKLLARFTDGGAGRVRAAGRGPEVRVAGRAGVGRHASVVIVRMGARFYALGVTEQQVRMLTDIEWVEEPDPASDPAAPAGTPMAAASPSWRELVESLRERTIRR